MDSLTKLLIVMPFLVLGQANAAGVPVWLPSSESIQAITVEFFGIDDGVDFAIFDDTDGLLVNALTLNTALGSASIETTNNLDGTWNFQDADNLSNSLTISNGSFVFAFKPTLGTSWSAMADSWLETSANTWLIKYPGTTAAIQLIAVDVTPIPVPAAVWLFGSGLVGLVAVARRRR